jgi:hypothetical protein
MPGRTILISTITGWRELKRDAASGGEVDPASLSGLDRAPAIDNHNR